MFDEGATGGHERTRGLTDVAVARRRGADRLVRLFQSGAAKAILPDVPGPVPEIVILNTAGGLTGGDRIATRLSVGEDARATATTQAAERIYDCAGGSARVDVEVSVGARGRLDWLPQETILYDGADLTRRTRIDLGPEAAGTALEVLVFGRRAMGERLRRLRLSDRREFRRGGRPVSVEPLELDAARLGARPALVRGAAAIAGLTVVARGVEDAAEGLAEIAVDGVEAALSGWDGRIVMRAFAVDALPLRRYLTVVLRRLRACDVPQVWQR